MVVMLAFCRGDGVTMRCVDVQDVTWLYMHDGAGGGSVAMRTGVPMYCCCDGISCFCCGCSTGAATSGAVRLDCSGTVPCDSAI